MDGNVLTERRGHLTGRRRGTSRNTVFGNHEVTAGFDDIASYISRAWVSRAFNYRLTFQTASASRSTR